MTTVHQRYTGRTDGQRNLALPALSRASHTLLHG